MTIIDRVTAHVPPTEATQDPRHQVQQFAVGAAAAADDWVTPLGANLPNGLVRLRLQALAATVYVRFRSDNVAATTTANGLAIAPGASEEFDVDPKLHKYIDQIGSGVGTLKVQVVAP